MFSTSSDGFADNMDLLRKRYDRCTRTTRIRRMADEMSLASPGIRAIEECQICRPLAQSMVVSPCQVSGSPSRTGMFENARSEMRQALVRDGDNFWIARHACGSRATELADVNFRVSCEKDLGDICASEVCAADEVVNSGLYRDDLVYLRQRENETLLMRVKLKHQAERQVQQRAEETELIIQTEEEPTSFRYSRELEKIRARQCQSSRFSDAVCAGPTSHHISNENENCKSHYFVSGSSPSLAGDATTRNNSLPVADVPFACMSFDEKMECIRGRWDSYDRGRRVHCMADDERVIQVKPAEAGAGDKGGNRDAEQQEFVRETSGAEERCSLVEVAQNKIPKLETQCDFWSASHICGGLSKETPNLAFEAPGAHDRHCRLPRRG